MYNRNFGWIVESMCFYHAYSNFAYSKKCVVIYTNSKRVYIVLSSPNRALLTMSTQLKPEDYLMTTMRRI
jgi:hypothetical protein